MGQQPACPEPVARVVELRERVGAVALFDRPGRAYEAVQDLIDARLPCERIAFLAYAERDTDSHEIHGHGRYVHFRAAGGGSGHAAGDEVSGAAVRRRVIEMVTPGQPSSSAAEYVDAVIRGASLVVVDADEALLPQVEAILDRYDRINDASWNWAWQHGGRFGRDALDDGLIDDDLPAPLTVPLHRVGPYVWRHAVLVGRTTREPAEDLEQDDESWDDDEGIRFPSPEPEPPAELPEEPEQPPRDPN